MSDTLSRPFVEKWRVFDKVSDEVFDKGSRNHIPGTGPNWSLSQNRELRLCRTLCRAPLSRNGGSSTKFPTKFSTKDPEITFLGQVPTGACLKTANFAFVGHFVAPLCREMAGLRQSFRRSFRQRIPKSHSWDRSQLELVSKPRTSPLSETLSRPFVEKWRVFDKVSDEVFDKGSRNHIPRTGPNWSLSQNRELRLCRKLCRAPLSRNGGSSTKFPTKFSTKDPEITFLGQALTGACPKTANFAFVGNFVAPLCREMAGLRQSFRRSFRQRIPKSHSSDRP